MRWNKVFNTNLKSPMWRSDQEAAKLALECGYRLMTWNGKVRYLWERDDGSVLLLPTNVEVEDLE